jgi:hypothetical protein
MEIWTLDFTNLIYMKVPNLKLAIMLVLISFETGYSQVYPDIRAVFKPSYVLVDSTYKARNKYKFVPYVFKTNDLPFFCKMEEKLQSKSNLNLRMRLGSVEYVDKLESKN